VPKVRNITDRDLYVPSLDRLVKPDEVIEVPDLLKVETGEFTEKGNPVTRTPDLGEVWPESLWSEVATPKSKKGDD
jgi:hypothetical protein